MYSAGEQCRRPGDYWPNIWKRLEVFEKEFIGGEKVKEVGR